jgi:hypothetical protein
VIPIPAASRQQAGIGAIEADDEKLGWHHDDPWPTPLPWQGSDT